MRSMMSSALRKHGNLKLEGMADSGNLGTMWRGLFVIAFVPVEWWQQ